MTNISSSAPAIGHPVVSKTSGDRVHAPAAANPAAKTPEAPGAPEARATRTTSGLTSPGNVETPGDPLAKGLRSENVPQGGATDDLTETVDQLNGLMQSIRRELHFSIDEVSGRTIIKVVDSETQEVIRNIPAEEVAKVMQNIGTSGGLTAGLRA